MGSKDMPRLAETALGNKTTQVSTPYKQWLEDMLESLMTESDRSRALQLVNSAKDLRDPTVMRSQPNRTLRVQGTVRPNRAKGCRESRMKRLLDSKVALMN